MILVRLVMVEEDGKPHRKRMQFDLLTDDGNRPGGDCRMLVEVTGGVIDIDSICQQLRTGYRAKVETEHLPD